MRPASAEHTSRTTRVDGDPQARSRRRRESVDGRTAHPGVAGHQPTSLPRSVDSPPSVNGGGLTVTSAPDGAEVYLDGRFAGRSPLTVPETVRRRSPRPPGEEGYLENARVVSIGAGKTAAVHVGLTSRAGQASPQQAPPATQAATDPEPLRIIVVDGDEAANIVADKIAVKPWSRSGIAGTAEWPMRSCAYDQTGAAGGPQQPAVFGNGQTEMSVLTDEAGRAAVISSRRLPMAPSTSKSRRPTRDKPRPRRCTRTTSRPPRRRARRGAREPELQFVSGERRGRRVVETGHRRARHGAAAERQSRSCAR